MDDHQDRAIFAITRPDSSLMKLYLVRSLLAGPLFFVVLPVLLVRYMTLRYKFDDEGVSMSWGYLFRREVHLTYARIQDIHLISGAIQRWLGLANVQIQTASGSAGAEMTIEGLREFKAVRDFLYQRMRGTKAGSSKVDAPETGPAAPPGELARLLGEIAVEVRATRELLEARDDAEGGH